MRVVDESGYEIKYDARAAPPSLATTIRRLSGELVQMDDSDASATSSFLLTVAEDYRGSLTEERTMFEWVRFPRHQHGYRWTDDNLAMLSAISEIRIYKIDVEFSQSGRVILETTQQKIFSFP